MSQQRPSKKSLDVDVFKKLVALGLNVRQIRIAMDHADHNFGYKMKQVLGMYPSVFIYKYRTGKIKL